MTELTVTANEAGQRFDKYLRKVLRSAPDSFIYKMLRKKNITLNSGRATGGEKTAEGDTVRFFLSDETFEAMGGVLPGNASADEDFDRFLGVDYAPYIDLLYENEDICFLNKPAGILTQSDRSGDISLNDCFLAYLIKNDKLTASNYRTFHPSVSNRLDRNTSGIVICGKTLKGLQENASMLKDRSLGKHYLALVGNIVQEKGRISAWLSKDRDSNLVKLHDVPGDGHSKIETEYEPVEVIGSATLLDIHLITGRTHQIRAQLAAIGHPIIGDYKYGDRSLNDKYKKDCGIGYQLLHSHRMICGDLEITAPLPKVWEKAMDHARLT